jgi:hypothetical protein
MGHGSSAGLLDQQTAKPTGLFLQRRAANFMILNLTRYHTRAIRYLANVLKAPYDDRPRSIKCANAAFSGRVASVSGGVACLVAVGFVKVVSI